MSQHVFYMFLAFLVGAVAGYALAVWDHHRILWRAKP